jgi:tRNA pseudouridine32 synthase / 23S rRNA pseudouridine746 synthase
VAWRGRGGREQSGVRDSDPSLLSAVRVVREGRRFVVIDKPAGLLSVPGKGADNQACAAGWVREQFPRASGPLVVHRLDMDTSGLLVFGLDEAAQRALSAQFEARSVHKRYVALVDGLMQRERGVIDAAMRLDPENRPVQVIDPVHGRAATTEFAVLSLETDRTRVELVPRTGRTHQLRVHCALIGHPIVGDVLYGRVDARGERGTDAERLMLHASELAFDDPDGGRVEACSAVPF